METGSASDASAFIMVDLGSSDDGFFIDHYTGLTPI